MKKPGTKLKGIAGALGLMLLIVSCIGAGLYGALLNTSPAFLTWVGAVTMAGLGVGIGTGLVEFSIILLITGEKGRRALKNEKIPKHSIANYIRNFLVVMSGSKEGLLATLIVGIIPWAYWVATPLYLLRPFQTHVPEYVDLVMSTSPGNEIVMDDDDPEEPRSDATPRDRYGNPVDADDEGTPAHPGSETAPKDTNGIAMSDSELPGASRRETAARGEKRRDGNGLPARADKNEARRESLRDSSRTDTDGGSGHTDRSESPKPRRPRDLPLKGKIMPVDVGQRKIDPVFFDLSDNVRPQRPDDVGAIAALFWSEARVGRYGPHGKALQWHCHVQVFDKTSKSLLAEGHFVGSEPPWIAMHGADTSGTRPYPQIRDFLNSLAHK